MPSTTSKILVAISSNSCHAWHYNWETDVYDKYLLGPLASKLGSRLITCQHDCTPQNIADIVQKENPGMVVWLGGGLYENMQCDSGPGIGGDCTECKEEFGENSRIAFLNCEFSEDVINSLNNPYSSFGYWTEMSYSMHNEEYNCDYYPAEPQPMDWYAPYYVLMRKVIEDIADCKTVGEAADNADKRQAGFLAWVQNSQAPYKTDYSGLSNLWTDLRGSIKGDPNARLPGCGINSSTTTIATTTIWPTTSQQPTTTSGSTTTTLRCDRSCPFQSDYLFVLRKAIIDYLRNPSNSKLSLSEIRTLLRFYLTEDLTTADCSSIKFILLKADSQIPDSILPKPWRGIRCIYCADHTACGNTNDCGQKCTCIDLDNDNINEYCILRPVVA